jgi:hemerythrin
MPNIGWDASMTTGVDSLDDQHRQLGKEEECMAKYRCPVAAQNIAAHRDFVTTFTSFRSEFDRDGATAHLVVRIEIELMRWLASHIKRTDTQLALCASDA